MTLALHPHGDLVQSTTDQFVADVCASIDRAHDVDVEIDFADVPFMDSEAFRALDRCGAYARAHGHSLLVSSLPKPYGKIIRLFHWELADDERCLTEPSGE